MNALGNVISWKFKAASQPCLQGYYLNGPPQKSHISRPRSFLAKKFGIENAKSDKDIHKLGSLKELCWHLSYHFIVKERAVKVVWMWIIIGKYPQFVKDYQLENVKSLNDLMDRFKAAATVQKLCQELDHPYTKRADALEYVWSYINAAKGELKEL